MTAFAELTDDEARMVLRGEACRRDFATFVKELWPARFPDEPLQWSRHMSAMCEHLQALVEGRLASPRLAIAVPPSTSKSVLASVFFPAWVWAREPWKKLLSASCSPVVVGRDADACRELVKSEEYRELMGIDWEMSKTQDGKLYYENTRGGARISRTVGQKTIGVKAHIAIVDDPIDPMDAFSDKAALTDHITWYRSVLVGRLISWDSPVVIVLQRTHDMDLIGWVLRQGGWEYLCLPAEYDPERQCVTSIFTDWLTEPGELLDPVRMPKEYLEQRRRDMGTQAYLAQYQQDPAPAGGTSFKLDWLQRAYYNPKDIPDANSDHWDYTFSSWDFTYTKSRDSDYVAGGGFGVKGIHVYLLTWHRKKMAYVECLKLMDDEQAKYPKMRARLIEKGGNGPRIIKETQRKVRAVIPISVQGDSKESRAAACSPMVEAGQFHIPDPAIVEWVREEYLPELMAFPHGNHDDQVDMTTQALNWVRERGDKRKTFSLHLGGR